MPLPTPEPGEAEQDFIARCAGSDVMNEEYPDQKQKLAICYSQWGEKRKTGKARLAKAMGKK